MAYELPEVKQQDVVGGQLYVWVPNGDDAKVVRLSDDGKYILESGHFETECWEYSLTLSGKFFGPMMLSGVDVDDLIRDYDD